MTAITKTNKQMFVEEGYCIIENAIPETYLNHLDQGCEECIEIIHEHMDKSGDDVYGISHRNKRYFIGNKHKTLKKNDVEKFLFSKMMAEITSSLIGDDVFLFNEQYVVKAAEKGMKFGWHQDSGYIGHPHTPYLTCWIPLIDVNENNGTVYILPFSQAKTTQMQPHTTEEGSNDQVGYFGNQQGIPVNINRGDIACFSSVTFHRSSPNNSSKMRAAFIAQYSPDIIKSKDQKNNWGLADPLVSKGEYIGVLN
jgi:ectoine hydroxylase-related dioxygenase (phytanoyl-CoA dioxygenase family)